MELLKLIIGAIAGSAFTAIIILLIYKVKKVSKTEYDILKAGYNETKTLLTVAEEKNNLLEKENIQLKERFEDKTKENNTLSQEKTEIDTRYKILIESSELLKNEIVKYKETIEKLNTLVFNLKSENSSLSEKNSSLNEKLSTQKEEILELHKNSQLQFEAIANKIFEEKSGKFTDLNKNNIEALLRPLGDNIESFRKKVEETYDKESKQRFSLDERVRDLIEQTNKISTEANNLATALKGQPKKQGNWGEMILESILQNSGLEKNREYFLQQTIKDDEDNNLRPDVLVKLPDNRDIIIDSKVSLVAYEKFSSSESPEDQAIYLNEHLKSIYNHIDSLSSKQYDNLETSLDFTMMFIPIEPAYLIAIQGDTGLWAYAYKKRILLISPTNLIACLKLMADLWKREQQSKNAMEIVNRGEKLYEKIVSFVASFEEIGKNIGKANSSYNEALNKLNSGGGNIIGQAIKLRSLGLKSSKEFSKNMLPSDIDEDDINIQAIGEGNEE